MPASKTGQMYINPTKLSYKILKWMQEHEGTNKLKHTTGRKLAEEIVTLPGVDTGEITIEQTISKMVKCNVIYRDKEEKSLYSDFRINYWHKSIPADILDNAPASVKRAMANTIDKMSDNQYMDDEGCVVTPNAVEKTEDPFNEAPQVIATETPATLCGKTLYGHKLSTSDDGIVTTPYIPKNLGTFDNPIVEDQAPWEEEPTTQEVSVPLEIKKDGKQITVNLSLTINL